jgi:FG-GAP repeat
MGHVVVRIHDHDFDGVADLAVGAPNFDAGPALNAGRVYFVSGKTGTILANAAGGSSLERFGAAIVEIDDVSFDGVPDLAVGAPGYGGALSNGAVRILSGATMQAIGIIVGPVTGARIGERLTVLDDQTGDGRREIATGARSMSIGPITNAGAVIIYDPATGTVIRQFNGQSISEGFGTDIGTVRDFSGDGRAELLAGAPGADPLGINGAGAIHVFDPVTGATLRTFFGLAANDGLGATCAGLDDLDFDGVADVLGGAPAATVNGAALAGSVFAFSTANGQILARFDGAAASDQLGRTIAGLDDVDADYVADFAIGSSNSKVNGSLAGGRVTIINGRWLIPLLRFDGPKVNAEFGGFIGPLGDLNQDGRNDYAIGWPAFDGAWIDQGVAHIHRGQSPSLAIAGTGQIGTPYEIRMQGHASMPAYLLIGAGTGNYPTPLGPMCLALAPFPLVVSLGAFDAGGFLSVGGITPVTGIPGPAIAFLQAAFMTPFAPAQGWLGQCASFTIVP